MTFEELKEFRKKGKAYLKGRYASGKLAGASVHAVCNRKRAYLATKAAEERRKVLKSNKDLGNKDD